MKISIHLKLTLIFGLAVVLGLLIGYFYLSNRLHSFLENDLQDNLKRELYLAKDFLELHIGDREALSDADTLADTIAIKLGLRATIIALDGTLLGDSDLGPDELRLAENHLDRPEIQNALQHGFGFSKRYSYTLKQQFFYMAVPFGNDKFSGILRFSIPLAEIELFQAEPQKKIIFAMMLIFLLSVGFTTLISFIVSKPLIEMADIAKAITKGDFSKKPAIYSKDEIGNLARALTYMSDEIKKNIETITQEVTKSDTILSSMFEGIMVTNAREEITLMNPSLRKIFMIDSDPLGKKPLETLRNSAVQKIVDDLLKQKNRFINEKIVMTQPEEKFLEINGVSLVRHNIIEGCVLVFHDITEIRRLETIRQDFVANVSHELRTPMASIKGYSETLLDGALDDKSNARDFINIIHQDSNRLANLIDDLLDLSKIESGKMDMVFLPLEFKPIMQRTIGILEQPAREKSLTITFDISDTLPRISADDKRLSQVLLNLIDNAIKYTPPGGSIDINARDLEKLIQVNITDTGIGIPPEDISRIFERFYRVDKARSRELGGTGLGLSIVRNIVSAHGGEVWVQSEYGSGSTFSFTIPKA